MPIRTTTAIAICECTVLRTDRKAILEVLRRDQQFFKFFVSFIVSRNVRMQEDLIDRLFHTGENGWRACSCCSPALIAWARQKS